MLLAPHTTLNAVRCSMANGDAGIAQTLRLMRKAVRTFRVAPEIRGAATSIIFNTPEREQDSEVNALFEYVRDCVRYVRDVFGVETLQSPAKTLALQLGDCDDQTTLLASLLESVGYPTRFVVAAYKPSLAFEHVYLQTLIRGRWVNADPTEYHALGWAPPRPTRVYIERV